MKEFLSKFVQANSPDGGFLQSEDWRKFQESYGRKTFNIAGENFWANIIEHQLKFVGDYFYIPRGPLGSGKITEIVKLAEKEKASWVRIEPANNEALELLGGEASKLGLRIKKAPHDMQPKEIFVIDITKSEEELLAGMKSKTRYNIKLAEKKGVVASVKTKLDGAKELEEFLKLVKITAKRNGISAHPEEYYRKMWEIIPEENLKLYIAKFQDKIIAANLVLFYGEMATYLHGASDNEYREVMAPYLLQWRSIRDAKAIGCEKYDMGGVSVMGHQSSVINHWSGITKFKAGFSPETKPTEFPGTFDLVINSWRYFFYRLISQIKSFVL